MARPKRLLGLAACYFSVHLTNGTREFRWHRFLLFGLLPFVVGGVLTYFLQAIDSSDLNLIVAVLAVVASVLIGLLPLAHSILGQTNTERRYKEGEHPLAQQDLNRVLTLQDLHASISWAVVLLVVGLGACAGLAVLNQVAKDPLAIWPVYPRVLFIGTLYTVAASTALTFFDVAQGVFEGMESQAEAVKRQIRANMLTGGEEKTKP